MEDYEGLSCSRSLETRERLSDNQLSYIEEVLSIGNNGLLIDRIDEINDSLPPKAIDSDREVAMLISSVRDGIDPVYLEAPQDGVQIEQISERMALIKGVEYSEWKGLSFDERMIVLQK